MKKKQSLKHDPVGLALAKDFFDVYPEMHDVDLELVTSALMFFCAGAIKGRDPRSRFAKRTAGVKDFQFIGVRREK